MHIELRDIRKAFGEVKANNGISLAFEGGRIYGLLGENGAGKSTLMKILSGYQPPDTGEILLDGKATKFSSPAQALAAGVGMLYQDPLDFPPFEIVDNYLLGKDKQLYLNRNKAAKELEDLAARYGFEVDAQAYVDGLSLGERQQLELIRLLSGGAQALILDEPTTGISGDQKDALFSSIRKLAHEEGKTVILVSHKLDEVQELCDHAFVLRRGENAGETPIPCPNEKLVEMMFGQVPPRSERPVFKLEEIALELKGVCIRTYLLSVENVDLQVKKGEVFGLAGLEGSGQGLLLRACAGLQEIHDGQIMLEGEDVSGRSYDRMRGVGIAYVAAGRLEEGLVAGLSLTEHQALAAPEQSFFVNWNAAQREAAARIEQYQVVGRPASRAEELSGGNMQRFMFALLNSPLKLLLLDQPTRGLDVRSTNWIWEQLYHRREEGTAIVFISPDMDEIIERSDRIAVFSGGVMSRVVDAHQTSADELGHMIGGRH